ncbi:MAG: DEAD/DEAH box helicase, partial [Bacteroidales bacterium]|nr:DEAD/DEAH box helicase [Bacteroidales bacterium]
MENDIFQNELTFLKGVGENRANILKKELGIVTWGDLLYYFPYRYIDKSKYYSIAEINSDDIYVQVKGIVQGKELIGGGKNKRLIVYFADRTGRIELVFFKGLQWITNKLITGKEYVIFGKPSAFNGGYNFIHPEIEERAKYENEISSVKYMPLYNTTEKMKNSYLNTKALAKITYSLLSEVANKIPETLPQYIIKQNNLLSLNRSLIEIHYPSSPENLSKAKLRLKFEELFFLQLGHFVEKLRRNEKSEGFVFSKVGKHFNSFYKNNLPFELTNAQKRVIKEIRNDMRTTHQMNRLLQGDVGSGKTLVALMSMLIAVDNGFQAALLAPTEILSQQHYNSICKFLKGMNLNVALLLGSVKGKARKNILSNLE